MIRFAVIGTNTITDKFLQAASALPDFKLCAVYSRTLARAQEYAQKITFRLSLILWRRWPTPTPDRRSLHRQPQFLPCCPEHPDDAAPQACALRKADLPPMLRKFQQMYDTP